MPKEIEYNNSDPTKETFIVVDKKREEFEKSDLLADKMKIITLCGSTRFEKTFNELEKQLTLDGNIVLSCGVFGADEKYKEMLDTIHKYKIDISDEIFVINVDGYIGKSTLNEIVYAKSKNKVIRYLEGEE